MANDAWETPQPFFNWLDEQYYFNLDVAATLENTKCQLYSKDGLLESWIYKLEFNSLKMNIHSASVVFCNPPYSNIMPWITKAIAEIELGNCELVVFILPADMTTQWAKLCIDHASRIIHVTGYYDDEGKFHSGRISFDAPEGVKSSSNNKGTMIVEFNNEHWTRYIKEPERRIVTQYTEIKEIMG